MMRRKKNRGLFFASVTLMLLAVVMTIVSSVTAPAATAGEKSITVEVVHSDGAQADFQYTTDKEFLGELLQEEGLISGDEDQYGLFVTVVDGETADYSVDSGWWRLSCDGETATVGADAMPITDGSTYTWTYTIG